MAFKEEKWTLSSSVQCAPWDFIIINIIPIITIIIKLIMGRVGHLEVGVQVGVVGVEVGVPMPLVFWLMNVE